jgi:hypothetical protein
MPTLKRVFLAAMWPAMLGAQANFTFISPVDGSSLTVTPNQAVPVQMTIANNNSGLVPEYYTTQVTVNPTCPPAANPCGNYVLPSGTVPTFALFGPHASFSGAVATINFRNAPAGFYTIKVSVNIQGCANTLSCQIPPDSFSGAIQFTAQVVGALGAPSNVLPHFAAGGGFVTDFIVINNSAQAAQFSINFYNDAGAPASLPFNGLGSISTLTDALPGFGTGFYEAGNAQSALQAGWGLIKADPSITIQAVFRNRTADGTYFEAAVPAYPGSSGFRIPFDATTFPPTGDPLYTGFAVVNLDSKNPATVTCTARDFRGNVIPNAITIPGLNPLGHWANYLFPALTGVRGTIDCTSSNAIAGIGLRFIGTNAFSSLSVVTE